MGIYNCTCIHPYILYCLTSHDILPTFGNFVGTCCKGNAQGMWCRNAFHVMTSGSIWVKQLECHRTTSKVQIPSRDSYGIGHAALIYQFMTPSGHHPRSFPSTKAPTAHQYPGLHFSSFQTNIGIGWGSTNWVWGVPSLAVAKSLCVTHF